MLYLIWKMHRCHPAGSLGADGHLVRPLQRPQYLSPATYSVPSSLSQAPTVPSPAAEAFPSWVPCRRQHLLLPPVGPCSPQLLCLPRPLSLALLAGGLFADHIWSSGLARLC